MTAKSSDHTAVETGSNISPGPTASWGPWLFRAALAATLVFFWWLVIYRHGVTPHL